MDYIRLELQTSKGWVNINLPEDVSISIQETTPLWGAEEGGAFSYPFTIDIDDNLHYFGNSGDNHGESVVKKLDGIRFRLYCDNVFFKSGIVKVDDEVEVSVDDDGHRTVDISLESSFKQFEEQLEGVKVRDINLEQYNIQIGYCLPKNLPFTGTFKRFINNQPGKNERVENVSYEKTIGIPQTVIVDYEDGEHGGTYSGNFVNVQNPYNPNNPFKYPYCNVRSCYQRYIKDNDNWEKTRGVSVGEPNRMNSAPCFYFGFVHDVMFQQMNINISNNALNGILDYRRLAFFHFNCEYEDVLVENGTKKFSFADHNRIKCGFEKLWGSKTTGYEPGYSYDNYIYAYTVQNDAVAHYPLCKAYAKSENLPDIEIKDMVEAMENAFGARYIYDTESNSLDIILVRDVLGSNTTDVLDVEVCGDVIKTEPATKGIILKYASANEMSKNTLTKKEYLVEGSDQTTYNYNDYRYPYVIGYGDAKYNEVTKGLDYTQTGVCINEMSDLVVNITDNDLHVYIDPVTSNAYRIKVDKDAKIASEWYPSLFQVAGYRNFEFGDTSDEERVKTISIPFSPAVPTNANFHEEFAYLRDGMTDATRPNPKYGMLLDGEVHHNDDDSLIVRDYIYSDIILERIYFPTYSKYVNVCGISVKFWIQAIEDYEVSSSSDGPYADSEAEFTLGVMRGSGSDARLYTYEENYDGEGHSHYVRTAGSDAEFTSDTMDTYGNMYDYNGNGTTNRYVTYNEAKMYLVSYFPDANIDTMGASRWVTKEYMAAWGYTDILDSHVGSYPVVKYMTDNDGKQYYFLIDCISNVGSVYTKSGHNAYINGIASYATQNNMSLLRADAEHDGLFIGRYNTSDDAMTMMVFLKYLQAIYYCNLDGYTIQCPDNGLGYDMDDLISLKLKTEIPIDGDPSKGYYPVTNTIAQKRGLADKFHGTHFYWLMNAKTATIPCLMPASKLKDIDWFKRYDIAGYVGFVYRKSYNITMNGIEKIKIEQKYL